MVNILCIVVLNIAVNTWGMAYFNLDVVPPEFLNGQNTTLNATSVFFHVLFSMKHNKALIVVSALNDNGYTFIIEVKTYTRPCT
jgi:CheY-specific phosphatase CheX